MCHLLMLLGISILDQQEKCDIQTHFFPFCWVALVKSYCFEHAAFSKVVGLRVINISLREVSDFGAGQHCALQLWESLSCNCCSVLELMSLVIDDFREPPASGDLSALKILLLTCETSDKTCSCIFSHESRAASLRQQVLQLDFSNC